MALENLNWGYTKIRDALRTGLKIEIGRTTVADILARFADALTDACARLGVIVGRYSFDVRLFHPLLSAGFDQRTSRHRGCDRRFCGTSTYRWGCVPCGGFYHLLPAPQVDPSREFRADLEVGQALRLDLDDLAGAWVARHVGGAPYIPPVPM
jgi:hypothetical protein